MILCLEAMEPVDRYLTLVKHMTSVAFAKQELGYFLLKRPIETTETAAQPAPISFDTVLENVEVDLFAELWRIAAVKKREGNPYSDRISIGRASNCDVVLRVPSISKVQAHILCEPNGSFSLRANNSANPTLLNGHVVPASSVCPLNVGDKIAFGSMVFEFVDAPRLYKVLVSEFR
jgi:pSer/pThr/pTyr-binding forkhead associated (FHA) protein